jgi:hypothetical protein
MKEGRRLGGVHAGPESRVLEGVSWEEARQMQDAAPSSLGKNKNYHYEVNHFLPVLRIRDVYPGSDFFHPESGLFPSRIPETGSASKNISISTQIKWFLSSQKYDPGFSSRIRILVFTHPGSGGQKGTGSRIRIRNTAFYYYMP